MPENDDIICNHETTSSGCPIYIYHYDKILENDDIFLIKKELETFLEYGIYLSESINGKCKLKAA